MFQIIHDLKLDQNITLKGHVDNPYPWMKKADIIICSSKYEGLSTVIQEAMILGESNHYDSLWWNERLIRRIRIRNDY